MSECPRSHSNQTKIKIGISQRKLWGKRLKWKRAREKLYQSWAESIANAAKVGGNDQEELEWDSYEKIKREIALKELQQAAEKAKAKEMARIRAKRAAQIKTEKRERLAQRRKEREDREKVEGTRKIPKILSKQEKEELAVAEELKLKAKLVKIQKKRPTPSHVCREDQRAWERLDVEFIKRAQLQKTVSLADQIRLAKTRTGDVNGKAFSISSSSSESVGVSAEAPDLQFTRGNRMNRKRTYSSIIHKHFHFLHSFRRTNLISGMTTDLLVLGMAEHERVKHYFSLML